MKENWLSMMLMVSIYDSKSLLEPEESLQFQKKENHWKVKIEEVRKIILKFRMMKIN
jgi:predicted amino acid-binding ACT domain protein